MRQGSSMHTRIITSAALCARASIPAIRLRMLAEVFGTRVELAEREGFEPPLGCPKPDFESGAFDHSAISPSPKSYRYARVGRKSREHRIPGRTPRQCDSVDSCYSRRRTV